MSERGKNSVRLKRLFSIGAAWPQLIEEVSDALDSEDAPHVAAFFQVPFPLYIEPALHKVPALRPGLTIRLNARLIAVEIDELARLTARERTEGDDERHLIVSQMVAFIPLWHPRSEYYADYVKCVRDDDLVHRIIVPPEDSWLEHRAISSSDFEHDITRRVTRELLTAIRHFLPCYSVVSLQEAPMPAWLSNYFLLTAPGRVTFNRAPEPVLKRLPVRPTTSAPSVASSKDLQLAMRLRYRELTKFEHQLLAMNRLRLEGEKALALIGTVSVLEWFLDQHHGANPKRQDSITTLVNTGCLNFLSAPLIDKLREIAKLRNRVVHGAPPGRHSLTYMHGAPGRERDSIDDAVSSGAIEEIIRTALEIFRLSNLERARQARA